MVDIVYSKKFLKLFKKITKKDKRLKEEILEKVEMFKGDPNNPSLKTHANKGKLKRYRSFSVNYKIRIIFRYLKSGEAFFVSIGDHSVYDK